MAKFKLLQLALALITTLYLARVVHARSDPNCICVVNRALNYRTFDGVLIQYLGGCSYTLAQSKNPRSNCRFSIVANNVRGSAGYSSYTKSIEIRMFGKVFRLGPGLKVWVNNVFKGTTYTLDQSHKRKVRVFRSGRFIQFVAPSCNVKVGFDGRYNAFLSVNRAYSTSLRGMCGNCNRKKQDDYVTKSGKYVGKHPNRNNLIGNSWATRKSCHPTNVNPHLLCPKPQLKKIAAAFHMCGWIAKRSGPFRKCLISGRLNLKELMQMCLISMCFANRRHSKNARCEMFKMVDEMCAERKFTGISWRSVFRCPLMCGRNKFYNAKMNPCPRTCENHWYGTKSLCYKLPRREGCQCRRGFLRDGELCVRPNNCRCLECQNAKSNRLCAIFKRQNKCKQFPLQMFYQCRLACGMCKKQKKKNCVDYVLRKRCLHFKKIGKCRHRFYQMICAKTCRSKKCLHCPPQKRHVSKICHPTLKIRSVVYVYWVRNLRQSKCIKKIKRTHWKCGKCYQRKRRVGPCNFCTRRRLVTIYTWKRLKNGHCPRKPFIQRKTIPCLRKCLRNFRRYSRCFGHNVHVTYTSMNKRVGCYRCVRVNRNYRRVIRCPAPKTTKHCNRRNCKLTYVIQTFRLSRCRCYRRVRYNFRKCCCPRTQTRKICYKNRLVFVVTTFRLAHGRCYRKNSMKPIKKGCPGVRLVHVGQCNRKYCHRVIKFAKFIMIRCRCKRVLSARGLKCCCKKPFTTKSCIAKSGQLTVVNTWFRQQWLRSIFNLKYVRCHRHQRRRVINIRCFKGPRFIYGVCNRFNCRQKYHVLSGFRRNCRCFRRNRVLSRTCCCKPHPKTHRFCHLNKIRIIRTYVRKLRGYVCRYVKVKESKKLVNCPKKRIYQGKCRGNGGYTYDRIIYWIVKNCHCKQRSHRRKRRCPTTVCTLKPRPKNTSCNRKNCIRTDIYWYINRKTCKYYSKRRTSRCCCNHLQGKTWKQCNKRSGKFEIKRKYYVFIASTRRCSVVVKRLRVFPINCPKRPSTFIGKCGKPRRYFKIVTTTRFTHLRHVCRCQKRVSHRYVRCRCPPTRKIRSYCGRYRAKPATVHVYRYFRLQRNGCRAYQRNAYSVIRCGPVPRPVKSRCVRCGFSIKYFSRLIRNCRCLTRTRIHQLHCCCPKRSIRYSKCQNHRVQYRWITNWLLRNNRCYKRVIKQRRFFRCKKRYFWRRTACRDCNYLVHHFWLHVRNCRCVVARKNTQRRKCCCPHKPRKWSVCKNTHFWRFTSGLVLKGFRCVKYTNKIVVRIACKPRRVIHGKCHPSRPNRVTTILYYIIRNCKCIRQTKTLRFPCKCARKKSYLKRGPCRGYFRRVYKYVYKRVGKVCRWVVHRNVVEYCRCRRTHYHRKCHPNGRHYIVYTYRYVRRLIRVGNLSFKIWRCHQTRSSRLSPIKCSKSYLKWTRCFNHRRCERVFYHVKYRCRCIRRVKTRRCVVCNCRYYRRVHKVCLGSVLRIIVNTQRVYRNRCIRQQQVRNLKIRCPPLKRPLIRHPCNIRRGHHFYAKIVRLYRGVCKCRCCVKRRVHLVLCRCRRASKPRTVCINNSVWRTRIYYYVKVGQRCVYKHKDSFKRKTCPRPNLRVTRGCFRGHVQFRETVYLVRNCRCYPRSRLLYNRCRCPKTLPVVKCIRNRKVFRHTVYSLRNTGRLLSRFSSVRRLVCVRRHITRYIPQICRARPFVTHHCNHKTKVYTKRIHYYTLVRCRCIRKVRLVIGHCRCHKTRVIRHRCLRYHRRVQIIRHVFVNGRCVRRLSWRSEVCRCRPPTRRAWCTKNNVHYTQHIRFVLHAKPPCRAFVTTRRRVIRCTKQIRFVRAFPCNHKTRRQRIQLSHYVLLKCRCHRRFLYRTRLCKCPNCRTRLIGCVRIRNHKYHRYIRTCYQLVAKSAYHRVCVPRTRNVHTLSRCPPNRIVPITRCLPNGYRRYRSTIWTNRNCRCFKSVRHVNRICNCSRIHKPRIIRRCIAHSLHTTTTYYWVLWRGRCVRRQRTYRRRIVCRRLIRHLPTFRCNRKSCLQPYRTILHRALNCRCRWVLVRNWKRRCCCLQKPIHSKICLRRNNQWKFTRIVYVLFRSACIRRNYVTYRKVVCRNTVSRPVKHCARNCNGSLSWYRLVPINCRCHRRRVRVIRIKCCCSKRVIHRRVCDAKRGARLFITIRQVLVGYACVTRRHTRTIRIRCPAARCRFTYTKCVRNRYWRYVYCYRRRGCACRQVLVKREPIRCQCSKRRWTRKGPCNAKTGLQAVLTYAYYFDDRIKRCRVRMVHRGVIRCKCRKGLTRRLCKGQYWVVQYVWWRLVSGQCRIHRRLKRVPVANCRPGVVRRFNTRCNRATGVYHLVVQVRYIHACRCRIRTHRYKRYCNCNKRFPPKRLGKCVAHRRRVVTHIFYVPTKNRASCRRIVRNVSYPIRCAVGLQRVTHRCTNFRPSPKNPARAYQWVYFYSRGYSHCRCVRRFVFRVLEHCRCAHTRHTRRCINHRFISTVTVYFRGYFIRVRGQRIARCRPFGKGSKAVIACNEKLRHTRTKCHRNRYWIYTRKNVARHCKCVPQINRRRVCDCRCLRNIVGRVTCTRRYTLVKYWRIARKVNCRCVYSHRRVYFNPRCPRVTTPWRRGNCKRYRFHGIRKVYQYTLVRHRFTCKCSIRVRVHNRVCWCHPRVRFASSCHRNTVYRYRFAFHLNTRLNRCWRHRSIVHRRHVRCKRDSLHNGHCDPKRGLRVNRFLIKHVAHNCRCTQKRIPLRPIPCKCHADWRLVKRGRCNRACRITHIYLRYKYVNRVCHPVRKPVTRLCCCRRATTVTRCVRHNLKLRVRYVWRLNASRTRCLLKTHTHKIRVICRGVKLVRQICTPSGVLVRVWAHKYSHKCKCRVRNTTDRRLRCKCPRSIAHRRCYPRSGKTVYRTVTYLLRRGRCFRRTFTRVSIRRCRKPVTSSSKCVRPARSIAYYRYITTTYYRIVANAQQYCVCKRYQLRRRVLCACFKNLKRVTRCVHPNRGIYRTTTSYWVKAGRRCARVVRHHVHRSPCPRVAIRPGRCNANNLRVILYPRLYFKNCRCRIAWHRKVCNCRCNRGGLQTKCIRHHLVWTRRFRGYFHQCRCRFKYSRPVVRRVRCSPRVHRRTTRCGRNCLYFLSIYGWRPFNCRCRYIRLRVFRKVCCCRPSIRRHAYCLRKPGIHVRKTIRYVVNPRLNRCVAVVKTQKRTIRCRNRWVCRSVGACNRHIGKQRFSCYRYVRIGCACHIRRTTTFKLCPCHKRRFVNIACNKRTCLAGKVLIYYVRNRHTKRCVRFTRTYRHKCCCHRNVSRKLVCLKNRRFLVVSWLQFDAGRKQCRRVVKSYPRPVRCIRGIRSYPQRCNRRTCKRVIIVVSWYKSHCKCRAHKRSYRATCCCTHLKPYKRRTCHNGSWKYVSVTWHLHKNRCVKRRLVALARIFCGRRHNKWGRCNKLTCKQRFSHIWYLISARCKCVRRSRSVYRTCCCSKKFHVRYHRCDVRAGHKIYAKLSLRYNARTRNCDRVVQYKRIPVRCSAHVHVHKSRCRFIAKVGYVRKLTVRFLHRVACRCVVISRSAQQLCRCRRPYVTFYCHKNRYYQSTIRFVRINRVIVLARIGRRIIRANVYFCKALPKRVTLRRLPSCARRTTRVIGRCAKNGLLRYIVIIRSRKFCKCARTTKTYNLKCHCNRKPHVTRQCVRNRIVVSVYRRVFGCSKRVNPPQCGCRMKRVSRRVQRLKPCPLPKVLRITQCKRPGQVYHHIRYVYYRRKYCRCWRRTFNHPIRCKRRCANILKTVHCVYLNRKYGICRRNYRDNVKKLCSRTCGLCEDCPHKMLTFRTHKGFSYLHSIPKRHYHLFVLRKLRGRTASRCAYYCKRTAQCKAYEIHRVRNQRHYQLECTMFKISLRQAVRHHGVQLKWNRHMRTFTKFCGCAHSKKVLRVSACRCRNIRHQLKYCYKQVVLQVWRRVFNKCKRQRVTIKVPCRSCQNSAPRAWCRSHRKRCGVKAVRAKCRGECKRQCRHCYGLIGAYQVCDARTKRWKFVTVAYKSGGRKSNICMIREHVRLGARCSKCQPGTEIYHISTCSSLTNRRLVIRIRVRHDARTKRCTVHMIRRWFDCGHCKNKVLHRVGRCQRGRRISQFHFWYKARPSGRCVRAVFTDWFACDTKKCPKDKVIKGKCCVAIMKVVRIWFVKLPNGRCKAKRNVTFRRCQQRLDGSHFLF